MNHDNEGPREGQENDASSTPKPEKASPKPASVTALSGSGDPFLDELNRLSANTEADVLRFRAREEHARGLACLHESVRHMRLHAELIAKAEEIEGQVDEAEKNAEPGSSRRPVVPNDNRLEGDAVDPEAELDPPFALRSDGKVLINAARLEGRTVHQMRTWTGVVLTWMEAAEVKRILGVSADDAAALVLPRVFGRLDL